MALTAVFTALLLATTAAAQDSPPLDWRRSDISADVLGATGFGPEIDGARLVTVVALTPVDRTRQNGTVFRGFVMNGEVRCAQREWRILDTTFYAADYSVSSRDGGFAPAPLVRETPLHAAFTDVCDGGHTGPVGVTTDDPIAVLRWLGEQ